MGQKESILVKEATTDDYDEVMAIRSSDEVYDGKDYLQSSYNDIIKSPENTGFCVVLNKQIVAFALVTLVNDKSTIVLKAVRVKKQVTGRGIMKALINWITQHYMKKGAKTLCISFIQSYLFEKMQKGHLRLLTIRKEIYFRSKEISKTTLTTIAKQNEQIQVLTTDQLANIFSNDTTKQKLFPSDCFVSFWTPFRPIPSNVPFIMKHGILMLGSQMDCTDTMIISCGTLNKTKNVSMYFIELYGNLKIATDLRNHLVLHIKNCKSELDGEVRFGVFIDEWSNANKIYELFREVKIKHEVDRILLISEKKLRDMYHV